MASQLLEQVRVLDPVSGSDRVADVLIGENQIQAIAPEMGEVPTEIRRRDCRGWVLGPGLVDLYSHSGEPGFESRETLSSLTQAAVAGGFTRLAILPDTRPPLDHPGGLEWLHSRWAGQGPLQVLLWGAITQGLAGQHLTELAELAQAGVVGFSDGRPLENLALVRRFLEYARPLNRAIALWPCNPDLGGGVLGEGPVSIRLGLPASPAYAETAALAALLEIVAAVGTPVHIMRISTARSVTLLQQAKAEGLPITASTSWMHLLWSNEAAVSFDPNLHLAPPLGNPADQQALIRGVQTGVLDAIAIDHTPYTYEEKTVAFAEAPPGAIGLELALPLLWQEFVVSQQWTALQLWQALSWGPARCLQQAPARITPGAAAELTLFDPEAAWQVVPENLKSQARNTPWLGKTLQGRVLPLDPDADQPQAR